MSNPWISTFTGQKAYPLDLCAEQIYLPDIAHSLALTCRFRGHCREFYSVAQHSVLAAQLAPDNLKMAALLHDAAEAYLFDVPYPIKSSVDVNGHPFDFLESDILLQIGRMFGVNPDDMNDPVIKMIDRKLCMTEGRDLGLPIDQWNLGVEPYEFTIEPWWWENAEGRFLDCFECLQKSGGRVSCAVG